jgi:uracil-DNA glycosylase
MSTIFNMDGERALEELKIECDACVKCNHLGALTDRKVFGEGPKNASIMSISEAPGKEEYDHKRPYQGKAGQFWEGMLKSIGWERSFMYVCNSLKCRPMYQGGSNQLSPSLEEVDHCRPFLIKQVSIIRPRLLLVFGKPAALSLGILLKSDYNKPIKPRLGIQKEPYWYKDFDGQQRSARVALLYHPSYLMSKPEGRNYCFETYKQLCDTKKLFEADPPWDG